MESLSPLPVALRKKVAMSGNPQVTKNYRWPLGAEGSLKAAVVSSWLPARKWGLQFFSCKKISTHKHLSLEAEPSLVEP